MKICHVNLARGFRGGERQTELLIRGLAAQGVRQQLVCRHDSPLRARLARVDGLECAPTGKPYLRALPALRGADLVHAHEARAAQLACLGSLWPKRPYVITRRVPNRPKNNLLTRAVYRRAARTVVLSRAIAQALRQRELGTELPVIPSMCAGLPADRERAAALRARHAGRFIVGHVGALVVHHKGQDLLIEAARMLGARYQFVLVGTGRDEARLRAQARDLDNVEFAGFQSAVGDYLAAFDVLAFPSRHEGLGSSLLDAIQHRVPIVAAAVGGIPEVIEHERTGLLVPPDDAHALSQAVQRLHDDAALRSALAERAWAGLGRFQPDVIAARYLELYRDVLAQRTEGVLT